MSSDSTIVAAKQEYTIQLCDLLIPLLKDGFNSIWIKCKNNKSALKSFQEKLCYVPKWNQDIINNEYSRVIKNTDCKWLDKLIEAVFLSYVKVLSTIRIGKVKNINITIPDTKNFIHKCYIEAARRLWQDPHTIDDREESLSYSEIKRNSKRLNICLSESIEKTISKLIPIESILESYLNDIDTDSENSDLDPIPELSDEESDKENSQEKTNDFEDDESNKDNVYTNIKLNLNDTDTDIDKDNVKPVYDTDIFMKEPEYQKISEDLPELEVAEGNDISDLSMVDNNNNIKNIVIEQPYTPETSEKKLEEEQPFFSDSDDE